jgi:hypothetical protein
MSDERLDEAAWVTDSNAVHVMPRADWVEHQSNDTCPCGPTLEHVPATMVASGWLYLHHALDGREKVEQNPQALKRPGDSGRIAR